MLELGNNENVPVGTANAGAAQARDYARVEAAIKFLHAQRRSQPSLDQLAEHVCLSPHHFQRLFRRWCGVTPKQLLSFLTVAEAQQLLAARWNVLDTSIEVGLSGPARLHDAFVAVTAMTPGEYKAGGAELEIAYAYHMTPFGWMRVMSTSRGICELAFVDANCVGLVPALPEWPNATLTPAPQVGMQLVRELSAGGLRTPVQLHLRGTNFQLQVWRALMRLPIGSVTGYSDIARAIGRPRAQRAVGSALGRNPVVWLVPCHRVIRDVADLGQYRFGVTRKRAMVAWECAQTAADGQAA
jgi:AraC family transcriptional regulator, regulatory protein of adaptative response / methylated-DNA-[protein]-cysteine methyltransferase